MSIASFAARFTMSSLRFPTTTLAKIQARVNGDMPTKPSLKRHGDIVKEVHMRVAQHICSNANAAHLADGCAKGDVLQLLLSRYTSHGLAGAVVPPVATQAHLHIGAEKPMRAEDMNGSDTANRSAHAQDQLSVREASGPFHQADSLPEHDAEHKQRCAS